MIAFIFYQLSFGAYQAWDRLLSKPAFWMVALTLSALAALRFG